MVTTVSFFIPKYRHHKGSGQAFVQVAGKRHYLGKFGSAESQERYARFVAERAARPAADPSIALMPGLSDLAVAELAVAYLEYAEQYYRHNGQPTRSIEEVKAAIDVLVELYSHASVADFSPLCLLAIQAKLASNGRARTYVNKLVGYIKRIFKWGVSRQMVPPAVHTSLSTVEGLKKGRSTAREPEPVKPVADDVVNATLPFLSQVVADMVRFQRLTGCRPSEVCQVRPVDIDRSREVWEYRPAYHKTDYRGKERVVFIGPKGQGVLRRYLLRAADAYCFCPADADRQRRAELHEKRKTPLCRGNRPGTNLKKRPKKKPGACYTSRSYHQAVRLAVIRANVDRTQKEEDPIPAWHPNQLRHSAATVIRRDYGLEAAQVVLGHAKANITEVYAERDHQRAAEVMAQIG